MHLLVIDAMILQENNNDRKKLRNGKCINIESISDLNKINEDIKYGISPRNHTKKSVKRKGNRVEELEAKSPMLAQTEEVIYDTKPDLTLTQKQLDLSDESESNIVKKTKTGNNDIINTEESKILFQKSVNVHQKCEYCCQKLSSIDIKLYPGHPNGAVEEMIALTDPRLSLFTGEEVMVHESDERPQNKITHFW